MAKEQADDTFSALDKLVMDLGPLEVEVDDVGLFERL